MTLVTAKSIYLYVHERPTYNQTPYPWGVVWICTDGTIKYDDTQTTEEYAKWYVEQVYRPHLNRL